MLDLLIDDDLRQQAQLPYQLDSSVDLRKLQEEIRLKTGVEVYLEQRSQEVVVRRLLIN